MKTYAFIFARGGSKGLPLKNTKLLGGIPLIGHAIRTAKAVVGVDKILVSTESNDIAMIAKDFAAEIIQRPAELASDTAAEWLAWKHAVQYLSKQQDHFDVFLSLPTTSPLRLPIDVEQCLAMLQDDTDAVISVTPAARSPYFNMVTRQADGLSKIVSEQGVYQRRQDAPSVYDMTTVAYVTRPDFILQQSSLFNGRVRSVVIPKERAVDIDDAIDFKIAEMLYYERINNESK